MTTDAAGYGTIESIEGPNADQQEPTGTPPGDKQGETRNRQTGSRDEAGKDEDSQGDDDPNRTYTRAELKAAEERAAAKARKATERREQRRADRILDRVTRPERQQQNESTQQPPKDTGPKREQFATEDEWLDAKLDHRDGQRKQAAAAERARERNESIQSRADERYESASDIDEDFDRKAFDKLPMNNDTAVLLIDSDVGAEMMVYLLKNPAEAKRLADLDGAKLFRALTAFESQFTDGNTPEPAAAASRAPKPPAKVGVGGTSNTGNDLGGVKSQAEYERRRGMQGAPWARRTG